MNLTDSSSKAMATVMGNWHNVLRAISMASGKRLVFFHKRFGRLD